MSHPTVFVGSSSEGRRTADAVQVNLERDRVCEVTIWDQGPFGLTLGTLESLVVATGKFDFAVLVLTADDLSISRGTAKPAARDNVLFELGLFIGSLGRDRTFILCNAEDRLALPSDLAGVTAATFFPHADGDLVAATGGACTRIRDAIEKLGIRHKKSLRDRQTVTHDAAGWLPCLRDGSEVGYREVVSGVVADLSPGTEAWILVQPVHEPALWPQNKLLVGQTGSFQTVAQFGQSETQNIGDDFIVLLVMASPDASRRFRDFRTQSPPHGLDELPPGVLTLAQVAVTRH